MHLNKLVERDGLPSAKQWEAMVNGTVVAGKEPLIPQLEAPVKTKAEAFHETESIFHKSLNQQRDPLE